MFGPRRHVPRRRSRSAATVTSAFGGSGVRGVEVAPVADAELSLGRNRPVGSSVGTGLEDGIDGDALPDGTPGGTSVSASTNTAAPPSPPTRSGRRYRRTHPRARPGDATRGPTLETKSRPGTPEGSCRPGRTPPASPEALGTSGWSWAHSSGRGIASAKSVRSSRSLNPAVSRRTPAHHPIARSRHRTRQCVRGSAPVTTRTSSRRPRCARRTARADPRLPSDTETNPPRPTTRGLPSASIRTVVGLRRSCTIPPGATVSPRLQAARAPSRPVHSQVDSAAQGRGACKVPPPPE